MNSFPFLNVAIFIDLGFKAVELTADQCKKISFLKMKYDIHAFFAIC